MVESPTVSTTNGERCVVLVLGPGRSGTSTIAGALAMTGLEVPGESIGANRTNPSGFYEPRWVVDLHKELLAKSRVRELDTSPLAILQANEKTSAPAIRRRLADWLGERLETQPRLVVKDPRTIWFRQLWDLTCGELGVDVGYVTMLRHPAEVAGSRETYYRKAKPGDGRDKQILRVAGWINVLLTAERETRGRPRTFVRYTDLIDDWRAVLTRIAAANRLELDPPTKTSPHPVDAFIDPTLHRVTTDWSSVDVPAPLRDIAERTWNAVTALADSVGDGTEDAATQVDAVRHDYAELVEIASVVYSSEARRQHRSGVRRGRRQRGTRAVDESPDAGHGPEPG